MTTKRFHGDVVELRLSPVVDADLPEWEPGSHIDLLLPGGLVRQYSLCGSPSDRSRWTVAARREADGKGGSVYLYDKLNEGDELDAVGPRNHFRLEPASRFRFLAGGIGITPILPMIEQAERRGTPWSLTFCGRTRDSMPFLADLLDRHRDRVRVHADDRDGLLDVPAVMSDPGPGERLYACGPTGLLDVVQAQSGSWPLHTVHWERFAAVAAVEAEAEEFEVELALSGITVTVPAERSILDVCNENGVPVLSSCTEGTCGTCETGVLAGEVDHRDAVLSPEEHAEGEVMMVCVSRAKSSRLVLDL